MDWQMLGGVGEIVGAIGVIATLGYLATQVRHSRLESQSRDEWDVLKLQSGLLSDIAVDADLAQIFRRGLAADPGLSPDEWLRFRALILQFADIWGRQIELENAGQRERREGFDARRREIAASPGFKMWFEQRKHWLNADLRAILEQESAMPGVVSLATTLAAAPYAPPKQAERQ